MAAGFVAASAGDAISRVFPAPILEREGSYLLRRVSEEGGYAFVDMSTMAGAGSFKAAEAALEMAWEQLHSGPWNSVLPVWRDAYSMACLMVAKFHFSIGDLKETLRVLDMGVILGGMLLRKDLNSAIKYVTAEVLKNDVNDPISTTESLKFPEEYSEHKALPLLPARSLSSKPIERLSAPSMERFLCDCLLSDSPVVISDSMNHWPAMVNWNDLDYLKKIAGSRTVPVEVGKNYLCPEWKQELIPFSHFLERIQSNVETPPSARTYLAQHQLFEQIEELKKDIVIPDYCFVGGGELRSVNAWFGPSGTVTPLHHDPHHNILCQVVGKKYVRLYPSSFSEELHPFSEPMLCNSSQVDLDEMDEGRFPGFEELGFLDCVLMEGEMLYIPPKWWHYVRSLSISFSASFWWS